MSFYVDASHTLILTLPSLLKNAAGSKMLSSPPILRDPAMPTFPQPGRQRNSVPPASKHRCLDSTCWRLLSERLSITTKVV